MFKKICNYFLNTILTLFLLSHSAAYGQGISIIRDSETEDFLYDITRPIFKAADLNPDDIKIYIVNDNNINAFVYGGQKVFINTGLIIKYDDPDVLLGVIAHEAGHIASGHLARSSEEMNNMGKAMILTYLAGIATAIAAQPDVGYAMIMGGNQVITRLALKYTRTQEESADRLALKYLQETNYSAEGLLKLLTFFNSQETGYKNLIDEYALTHPVSKKRINYIKANLPKSSENKKIERDLHLRMSRVIVKLEAFLEDPNEILAKYNQKNNPLSKYARSIAYFKKGEVKKSLKELDELIIYNEDDGYLWELKGQILFESSFVKEAIIAYKKAIELQNHEAYLAKISLASAIISLNSGDKDLTNFAINNLLNTLPSEKNDPNVFRQLSKAYHQIDNEGRAYLALAELNLLKQDKEKTIKYAKLAKKYLDENDKSGIIKAEDILETVKQNKDDKK